MLVDSSKMSVMDISRFITPADEKTHGFNRVDDSPHCTVRA